MSRAGDILPERYIGVVILLQRRAMAIRVRLRELLKERGMAQTELQARSGLGYSTINALYHGKTERVEFATLDALCEVLDCGVAEILEHLPDKKRGRS
jgi:putative transcriptional regulator